MRATCTWPDVEPHVLTDMFTDLSRYDEWIWPIGESEVRRREPTRALVYQRQHIWGLSDREVLLWVQQQPVGPHGLDVTWTVATEEPLVLRDGSIRTPVNTGIWSFQPANGGGTLAIHQIEVSAGGVQLPQWLIRAIQTRGFKRVMDDVHSTALAEAQRKKAK